MKYYQTTNGEPICLTCVFYCKNFQKCVFGKTEQSTSKYPLSCSDFKYKEKSNEND